MTQRRLNDGRRWLEAGTGPRIACRDDSSALNADLIYAAVEKNKASYSARYCMGCSAFPPFSKRGVGGIYGGRAKGKRCKIPLSTPFVKGEGRVAAALGGSWF
jgi:hypothetical protein